MFQVQVQDLDQLRGEEPHHHHLGLEIWNLRECQVHYQINAVFHISTYVPQDPEFYLLWLRANYPRTWTGFGHPQAEGSFRSWLVLSRDPHGLRPLWAAGKWTHLCLGYSKATGEFKIIRDGERLDVTKEGPDPDFTGVEIPEDFLSKTYIGRCSHSFNWACSSPESEVTTSTAMNLPLIINLLLFSPISFLTSTCGTGS